MVQLVVVSGVIQFPKQFPAPVELLDAASFAALYLAHAGSLFSII